jgi:hypothetical protein
MANTLLIEKNGYNKFWHTHNENALTKFAISDFECSIDGDTFKITEFDGAVRFNYLIENITIKDNTTGGAEETFTDPLSFYNRLIELSYTPFLNNNQTTTANVILKKGMGVVLHKTQVWIDANFDETGLGILEMVGWAKKNGQNGTEDIRDRVSLAQGTIHLTLGDELGNETKTLETNNLPDITVTIPGSNADNGDPGELFITANSQGNGNHNIVISGGEVAFSLLQPSLVELHIERTEDLIIFSGGQAGTSIPTLNKFIITPTIEIDGFNVSISGGEWMINGVDLVNASGATFTVNATSIGKTRIDLIVADNSADYFRIQGVESVSNPASPSLPLNTLLVSILTVSDGVVTEVPLTSISDLISTDSGNVIVLGSDGKLYVNSVGGIPTLQQVTDTGNRTTNEIISTSGIAIEAVGSGTYVQRIVPTTGISADQDFTFPNRVGGGALALASDIPTITGKEDSSNKVTTFTGNEASTTKFPVVKAIIDYFNALKIKSILGQATASIDGWLSSTDWNIFNGKQNALGFTPENVANKTDTITGNESSSSLYASIKGIVDWLTSSKIKSILGVSTLSGSNTGDETLSSIQGKLGSTSNLSEGTNMYWTTARGLALVLTGLSAASGTFTSTDTLLTAFGKIKYLIDNIATIYQAILTDVNFGTFSTALTAKTTPIDADTVNIVNSIDGKANKLSFSNLKAWIQGFLPVIITSETGINYFNDFTGLVSTATNDGMICADGNVSSTLTPPNSDLNKQGWANVNSTNNASGYGNIYIGNSGTAILSIGGGAWTYEALIYIPNLSTSSERFSALSGFSNGVSNGNNATNTIAFLYDEGGIAFTGAAGASANWKTVTTSGGTRTITDSAIAVITSDYVKLKIIVNTGGTSVSFYINGTLVATHTTNIPTGTSNRMNIRNYIQKSIGITQRQLVLDYVKLQQIFTTQR